MTISRKAEKKQIEKLRKRGIGISKTEDKPAEELRKEAPLPASDKDRRVQG
jgi:biotin operon repressor